MSKDIDPVKYAKEIVGCDPFASYLGIHVEEVKEAYALCSITIMPQHLNAVNRAHGALVYALSDQALAVASNSMGYSAIALNFNINYISGPADGEKIYAEANPVNIGKKISVWKVNVTDSEGKLIASGEGVAYHKKFK